MTAGDPEIAPKHSQPSHTSDQTLNVLHHTIPHKLCGLELKDMHGLPCFACTHSERSKALVFYPWSITRNTLNSWLFTIKCGHFLFIPDRIWFLEFTITVFTIYTRMLRVQHWCSGRDSTRGPALKGHLDLAGPTIAPTTTYDWWESKFDLILLSAEANHTI